ncbi:hypothetical protein K466DRAFT_520747 [Polyporus arcularius HHB13444]|uniref:F-box domain-containing protein n=1 Tax=Polyporus arcularius HHB13444 TaxID=1314778 RepID=A0A5C3PFE6_9APHY|nr:hypothetical protein K466DRAFT_520747 [Polyporus arcularius HHB13444]
MARRTKKAPKPKASNSTKVARIKCHTITDLPPELLHMVFTHLRNSGSTGTKGIKACLMLSRLLRDVAVSYLEFTSPRVHDLDHFLSFMRRHSPLQGRVQRLSLSDMSLDTSLVRQLTQLFPNMGSLTLEDICCTPPLSHHHPKSDPETLPVAIPRQLEKLWIKCGRARTDSGSGWSLCGIMHIVSLLAPEELIVSMSGGVRFGDKFDPTCLTASPAVRDLRVCLAPWETPKNRKSIANVLDALSRTLAPDIVQTITVDYDFKATLRALSTLLKRIGGNVTALDIHGPSPWAWEDRQIWMDPFDDWRLLDLRACKKLESLELPPLYVRPREEQRPLSYVACGLLANYISPTLREFKIDVRDFTCPETLEDREVLNLREFDKVMTQTRFPNLQKFGLTVAVSRDLEDRSYYVGQCRDAARHVLHRLHSRGVLGISVLWR